MPLRPEFKEALGLLALAIDRLVRKGYSAPILVGGAAVELYTGGAVTSGDFDFVSSWQKEFFVELMNLGFERPATVGWLERSLLHPRLDLAVQVVSNRLMDGHTPAERVLVVAVAADGEKEALNIKVIPIEDLIADRMGQALSGTTLEKAMQDQSIKLYRFADDIDKAYLDYRIRMETSNQASLETLEDWVGTCAL